MQRLWESGSTALNDGLIAFSNCMQVGLFGTMIGMGFMHLVRDYCPEDCHDSQPTHKRKQYRYYFGIGGGFKHCSEETMWTYVHSLHAWPVRHLVYTCDSSFAVYLLWWVMFCNWTGFVFLVQCFFVNILILIMIKIVLMIMIVSLLILILWLGSMTLLYIPWQTKSHHLTIEYKSQCRFPNHSYKLIKVPGS